MSRCDCAASDCAYCEDCRPHSFVEPAESSDDAAVNEVLLENMLPWPGSSIAANDRAVSAVRQAFAAGRAAAYKRCEAIASDAANKREDKVEYYDDAAAMADAIADAISRAGGTTK